MKKCVKCNKTLPLDSFPVRSSKKPWRRRGQCKECCNLRHKNWNSSPEGKKWRKEWRERNKEAISKREKEYRAKNRHKSDAYSMVCRAIRKGLMEKEPCAVCGWLKVDMHHEDYNRPYDVTWLCRKHHMEVHKTLNQKEGGAN